MRVNSSRRGLCKPRDSRGREAMLKRRMSVSACGGFVAFFMLTGPEATPVPPARAQPAQPSQSKPAPTLLVLNKAENSLALVDPSTMSVVARVQTGEGPHEVAVSSDGRTAYVSNYGAEKPGNSLSVIDLAARKAVRRVDIDSLFR